MHRWGRLCAATWCSDLQACVLAGSDTHEFFRGCSLRAMSLPNQENVAPMQGCVQVSWWRQIEFSYLSFADSPRVETQNAMAKVTARSTIELHRVVDFTQSPIFADFKLTINPWGFSPREWYSTWRLSYPRKRTRSLPFRFPTDWSWHHGFPGRRLKACDHRVYPRHADKVRVRISRQISCTLAQCRRTQKFLLLLRSMNSLRWWHCDNVCSNKTALLEKSFKGQRLNTHN